MFEVGDLLQRTKPFPNEKDNLWIVISIEEENDIRPITFITIMNCKNQYISKFIGHIIRDSFEKVE